MSNSVLPMALGPEPPGPDGPPAGPFSIRLRDGVAYLVVRGTGMAFTACLSHQQLQQLARLCAGATACLDQGTLTAGGNVLPFRARPDGSGGGAKGGHAA